MPARADADPGPSIRLRGPDDICSDDDDVLVEVVAHEARHAPVAIPAVADEQRDLVPERTVTGGTRVEYEKYFTDVMTALRGCFDFLVLSSLRWLDAKIYLLYNGPPVFKLAFLPWVAGLT